jgi:phosphoenolpyruvate carboxykinase (ATP)
LAAANYASMLGDKIKKHKANVWLINTGWTGGAYGTGTRIKLQHTRNMVEAILKKKLENIRFEKHPIFGMLIPEGCAGVPASILYPRDTWKDKDAYDQQARVLAEKFIKNFIKYAAGADPEVAMAGPVV